MNDGQIFDILLCALTSLLKNVESSAISLCNVEFLSFLSNQLMFEAKRHSFLPIAIFCYNLAMYPETHKDNQIIVDIS